MKVFIHEYADSTALLFSREGRVLGIYTSVADARDGYLDQDTVNEADDDREHRQDFDTAA